MNYTFERKLWKYAGEAAWYFISVPTEYTDELKKLRNTQYKNFGSIKVSAEIGTSKWQTSIFPDSKSGCYLLPVKKEVRLANNIKDGDDVNVFISVIDS